MIEEARQAEDAPTAEAAAAELALSMPQRGMPGCAWVSIALGLLVAIVVAAS